jgi:hypothetical protein
MGIIFSGSIDPSRLRKLMEELIYSTELSVTIASLFK